MAEDPVAAEAPDVELERIFAWRTLFLLSLGYDWTQATSLAHNTAIDPHELERVIQCGASPEQALAIVA